MASEAFQENLIDKGESIHSSSDKYVKEVSNLLDGGTYVKVSGGYSSEMSSNSTTIRTEHGRNFVMDYCSISWQLKIPAFVANQLLYKQRYSHNDYTSYSSMEVIEYYTPNPEYMDKIAAFKGEDVYDKFSQLNGYIKAIIDIQNELIIKDKDLQNLAMYALPGAVYVKLNIQMKVKDMLIFFDSQCNFGWENETKVISQTMFSLAKQFFPITLGEWESQHRDVFTPTSLCAEENCEDKQGTFSKESLAVKQKSPTPNQVTPVIKRNSPVKTVRQASPLPVLKKSSPVKTIRQASPVLKQPSPVVTIRQPSPVVTIRQPSPVVTIRQPSPVVRKGSPVLKQPSPVILRQPSPVILRQPSPVILKQPSPVVRRESPVPRQPSPILKQPSPVPNRESSLLKQPSPTKKQEIQVTPFVKQENPENTLVLQNNATAATTIAQHGTAEVEPLEPKLNLVAEPLSGIETPPKSQEINIAEETNISPQVVSLPNSMPIDEKVVAATTVTAAATEATKAVIKIETPEKSRVVEPINATPERTRRVEAELVTKIETPERTRRGEAEPVSSAMASRTEIPERSRRAEPVEEPASRTETSRRSTSRLEDDSSTEKSSTEPTIGPDVGEARNRRSNEINTRDRSTSRPSREDEVSVRVRSRDDRAASPTRGSRAQVSRPSPSSSSRAVSPPRRSRDVVEVTSSRRTSSPRTVVASSPIKKSIKIVPSSPAKHSDRMPKR
jgi:hypothetical protein